LKQQTVVCHTLENQRAHLTSQIHYAQPSVRFPSALLSTQFYPLLSRHRLPSHTPIFLQTIRLPLTPVRPNHFQRYVRQPTSSPSFDQNEAIHKAIRKNSHNIHCIAKHSKLTPNTPLPNLPTVISQTRKHKPNVLKFASCHSESKDIIIKPYNTSSFINRHIRRAQGPTQDSDQNIST
jgi:hypothetical protein